MINCLSFPEKPIQISKNVQISTDRSSAQGKRSRGNVFDRASTG